jgi:hypothetical protein
MSKEAYFEMCEQLGTEPVPEEIPLTEEDMAYETQQALDCYRLLTDVYVGADAYYSGKDLSGLKNIFDLLEVPKVNQEYIIDTIVYMDSIIVKEASRKRQAANKAASRARK